MSSDILNAPCNSADNFVFKHTKFSTSFNSYLPVLHYAFSAKSDGHLYISLRQIILMSYQCLSLGGLFKNTPPPSIADILNRLETVQENKTRPGSFQSTIPLIVQDIKVKITRKPYYHHRKSLIWLGLDQLSFSYLSKGCTDIQDKTSVRQESFQFNLF